MRRLSSLPAPTDAGAHFFRRMLGPASAELEGVLQQPSRPAAVLVGLVERSEGPRILLTVRAAHLPHHPGQISFPGGRLEPGEQPQIAALREAHEEVGLVAGQVEVLGSLPAQLTGTGFLVTPVVAWLASQFEPDPDPAEVEAAFEVPVEHLLLPENRRRGTSVRWGTRFVTEEFYFEDYRIWGATAAILSHFLEVIDAETI